MVNITGYLLSALIAVSCIYSFYTGGFNQVSNAVITSGTTAVELILSIIGVMATWGGIMKIAQDSGLTDKITKLISPILKVVFKGIDEKSKAFKAIAMNIAANIFGLGNAATPLGIEAMRALEEEENCQGIATRNMIILTIFNTSSLEIIPTTVAAMRLSYSSKSPLDILPCVLLISAVSLVVSILTVYLFDKGKRAEK